MQQHGSYYFACRSHPWGWGQQVKIQLFKNMAMLHIKLNGIMQSHILFLHTPSTPGMESKVKTICFSESIHVAYQIKGNGA